MMNQNICVSLCEQNSTYTCMPIETRLLFWVCFYCYRYRYKYIHVCCRCLHIYSVITCDFGQVVCCPKDLASLPLVGVRSAKNSCYALNKSPFMGVTWIIMLTVNIHWALITYAWLCLSALHVLSHLPCPSSPWKCCPCPYPPDEES